MLPQEATAADLATAGITTGPHPMSYERARLQDQGILTAREIQHHPPSRSIRAAGLVICRQRPQTKTGVVFFSLEDETGIVNVMVRARLFEKHRTLLTTSPYLLFEGSLQYQDGAQMLMARRVRTLRSQVAQVRGAPASSVASHDWH
jgi:error-prone DNA polymerase